MPLLTSRNLKFLGILGLMALSAVLCLIATAGSYWVEKADEHEGLWKHYDKKHGSEDIDGRDSLKATKTLMIMSCLCYGFAFAYWSLLSLAKDLSVKFLSAILFITCLLGTIALSVYTNSEFLGQRPGYKYGWTYALGWCSIVVCLTSAIVSLFLNNDGYRSL